MKFLGVRTRRDGGKIAKGCTTHHSINKEDGVEFEMRDALNRNIALDSPYAFK